MSFEDVEERDGGLILLLPNARCTLRLTNLFRCPIIVECMAFITHRSNSHGGSHRCVVYAFEDQGGSPTCSLRTCHL